MDPKNEPLEPTIEQQPERRGAGAEPEEDQREESGLSQPESSAQKNPAPGPQP
jgi:hypothetical protein